MPAESVSIKEVQFHEPDFQCDGTFVFGYAAVSAISVTLFVIGILALLQARGILDCGASIGSISTLKAGLCIGSGALILVFLLSLKPIIVACLKRSSEFTNPGEYPQDAPRSTFTNISVLGVVLIL